MSVSPPLECLDRSIAWRVYSDSGNSMLQHDIESHVIRVGAEKVITELNTPHL